MWANKVFLISSPFGLCLLILKVVVWIGVYGVFTEERFPPQKLAPIAPNVDKSEPSEPKTNQEEPTSEDDPATRDLAVFGMSVKNYAETQVRFLEGLNSPRSKIEPWEYPFDPYDVKVDSRGPTGLGPSGAGRPN